MEALPANASPERIREELEFKLVLQQTLTSGAEDLSRRMALQYEIAELRSMLRKAEQKKAGDSTAGLDDGIQDSFWSLAESLDPFQSPLDYSTAFTSNTTGSNYRYNSLANANGHPSIINNGGAFGGSSSFLYNAAADTSEGSSSGQTPLNQTPPEQSSSHLSLPTRKRPYDMSRSLFGDTEQQEAKSRRTTPSSNTTGFSSPPVNQLSLGGTGYSSPIYGYDSEYSSDPTARDEEIARQVAAEMAQDYPPDPEFILRIQKESEKKARERALQEQKDLELAIELSSRVDADDELQFLFSNQPPSSTFDNSFRGSTGHGSSNRSYGTPSQMFSLSDATTSTPIRNDGTQGTSLGQLPAIEFADSDDDDLTEITPSAFRSNGRYQQSNLSQFGQPYHSYTGQSGFAQQQNNQDQSMLSNEEFERLQQIQLPDFDSIGSHMNSGSLPFPLNYAQGLGQSAYGLASNIPAFARAATSALPSFGTTISSRNEDVLSRYGHQSLRSILNNNPLSIVDPYGTILVNAYGQPRTAQEASYIDYISHHPTKTAEEIKNLLENIRPDVELPPEDREGTPPAMKYPLMEHQKLGLTWLKNMEDGTNKGGILADDMGLGKTIQALALLVSKPSPNPERKTTLIVAPVALMKQWEREIQTKLKDGHQLKTYLLHGSKTKATWNQLKHYDVVLTTFGTLAAEYKRREAWDQKKRAAEASVDDVGDVRTPNLPCLSKDSLWYRVIIDEAQCIKNRTTKAALGACALEAEFRFCLTGTPMMNNVGELHALIEFLRIKPYNEVKKFNDDFVRPLRNNSQASSENALRKLQALLKAVLLRRTKKSEIDGKPILNLPERTNMTQHAVFNEDEQTFYKALETKTALQFNKYLKQGSIGRNYTNILVLLLRLRQACCHPHLIQDMEVQHNAEITVDEMTALAKTLLPDVVNRVKLMDGFECPICYDGVENPAIFIPCGHDTCTECFVKISNQSGQQNLARGNEGVTVKCPTCRGGIDPKKIIDYVTFKKVHMKDETLVEEFVDETNEQQDDDETDSEDSDDSDSVKDFVVRDSDDREESKETSGKGKKKRGAKGKGKAKVKKTLAELKKEAMKNANTKARYMRRLEKNWESSAKVDKCVEILKQVEDKGLGEKTIVFSQFTSLLDLLEVPISRAGWKYERYDGSMSATKRNDAVINFTDNPECKIMLVSLKAGNSGLNLVAASQVVILDPFWNPYIEEQAVDRAHRIGQLRPVTVHRILVQETVEDRILQLQDKKRRLIEGALDENASKDIARLGNQELAFLFGVGGAPR